MLVQAGRAIPANRWVTEFIEANELNEMDTAISC